MAIFLDTGNIEEITKYHRMGIIRGVTTNPTILLKDGVTGGKQGIKDRVVKIANLISPYPVSVEVTSNDYKKMLDQGVEYAKWADNISVKIAIHGPCGETDNLIVINELAKKGISVNATVTMSAQQCLLAALSGAKYVSLFGGRVNNMGYNVCEEIRKLRKVIDYQGLKVKVIVGSTREVLNVIEWLEAGADIITILPNLLEGMIVHPYTKETVQMFLDDAAKTDRGING